jgi:hypothetical protein
MFAHSVPVPATAFKLQLREYTDMIRRAVSKELPDTILHHQLNITIESDKLRDMTTRDNIISLM